MEGTEQVDLLNLTFTQQAYEGQWSITLSHNDMPELPAALTQHSDTWLHVNDKNKEYNTVYI